MLATQRDNFPDSKNCPTNFDDVIIRPSPMKPFETVESPERESLKSCDYCKRNFTVKNLARHIIICERLAQKPKREAFQAVAQRLSHVAQEDAVKPLMRKVNQKYGEEAGTGLDENVSVAAKKTSQARKKTTNGRTGADLFKEQQKGHLKCSYCERTFREEAYERHVNFCKEQYAMKQRRNVKEDPSLNLLLRRVKYRPPLPRTNSKESGVSSNSVAVNSKASRPLELSFGHSASKIMDSRTRIGVEDLSGKLCEMSLKEEKPNRLHNVYSPQERTSPSDYGSGESILSRSELAPTQGSYQSLGCTPEVPIKCHIVTSDSLKSKTVGDTFLSSHKNGVASGPPEHFSVSIYKKRAQDLIDTSYHSLPKTPVLQKHSDSAFYRAGSVRTKRDDPPGMKPMTPQEERPYPFNVAFAQKEEMMKLHRSNSMRAKTSGGSTSSVDWDSYLKPVPNDRFPSSSNDQIRFRGFCTPNRNSFSKSPVRTPVSQTSSAKPLLLNAESPMMHALQSDKRVVSSGWKANDYSHAESLEEYDITSGSTSPLSPLGSVTSIKSTAIGSSVSIKSSALGSISSLENNNSQQKSHLPTFIQKSLSSPSQPKFCHNCGNEFPIATASFCCHCGMPKLKLSM